MAFLLDSVWEFGVDFTDSKGTAVQGLLHLVRWKVIRDGAIGRPGEVGNDENRARCLALGPLAWRVPLPQVRPALAVPVRRC